MNFKRKIAPIITATLIVSSLFATTAFASGGEDTEAETGTVTEVEATAEDTDAESADESSDALTPDGNLTIVDDVGSSTEAGKQFITLVTKDGNYFYLIIDRDDEGEETVHFLNLVDEADLLALMDEEEAAEYEAAISEEDAGDEDSDTDVTDDEETNLEDDSETDVEEESADSSNTLILLALFAAGVAAVGIFLYFKMRGGRKPAGKNNPDPDDDPDEEAAYELPEDTEYTESEEDNNP